MSSSALLPKVEGRADYAPRQPEVEPWLPAMRAICARHGLATVALKRLDGGTNVVFASGADRIIKLYPPYWAREHASERMVAERVFGKLSVATPELYASGEIEGWPYLVMQRLDGVQLHSVWSGLDHTGQLRLAVELGELLAQLHALPTDGLDLLAAKWAAFVADLPQRCVARHRARGVAEEWIGQIPGFLERAGPLDPPGARVLLDGDFHDGHLLVAQDHGRWRLTGLYDFDDALLGPRAADFAAPGLFVMAGRRTLLRAFLRAYGLPDAALGPALSARLLAYTLIHRYRDLSWILSEVVAGQACATLDEVARAVYPLG